MGLSPRCWLIMLGDCLKREVVRRSWHRNPFIMLFRKSSKILSRTAGHFSQVSTLPTGFFSWSHRRPHSPRQSSSLFLCLKIPNCWENQVRPSKCGQVRRLLVCDEKISQDRQVIGDIYMVQDLLLMRYMQRYWLLVHLSLQNAALFSRYA